MQQRLKYVLKIQQSRCRASERTAEPWKYNLAIAGSVSWEGTEFVGVTLMLFLVPDYS